MLAHIIISPHSDKTYVDNKEVTDLSLGSRKKKVKLFKPSYSGRT